MRTLRLTLSYDGSGFAGWQVQPGRRTVQQTVTDAVERVTGERVVVHGSGRTDAGVHALGQVAHLQLAQARLPADALARALNTRLPAAIRVLDARDVPATFHARRDAVAKLYRYRIYRGPVCPPFLWNFVYHHPYPLDEPSMIAAASVFEGHHDFRSFAATPHHGAPPLHTTERTVFHSGLAREGDELIYAVEGRGFLHHMVRNLVGFLLDVGRGRRLAQEIPAVLAARSRAAAARTAPAAGLYLVRVAYREDDLKPDEDRTP